MLKYKEQFLFNRKLLCKFLLNKNAPLRMRTTVYDISLGSKEPRRVICTSRENAASGILFIKTIMLEEGLHVKRQ